MPLSAQIVGLTSAPFDNSIDARWLMAYAAALDDFSPAYFDTTRPLAAHPLFPVCYEWDSIVAIRFGPGTAQLSPAEQARAVHAEHDLHLIKPIQAGMQLRTLTTAVAVENRKPGALLIKRVDTVDAEGALVTRTYQNTLYRGVALADAPHAIDTPPPVPNPLATNDLHQLLPFVIPRGAAHTYTECARIWNPIHTDRAQALAAGLPDIILHGTATLARALSVLGKAVAMPGRIVRIGCRFSGIVLLPASLTLRILGRDASHVFFNVQNETGDDVISRGFVQWANS